MCSITEPRRAVVSCKHLYTSNPTERSNGNISRRYTSSNNSNTKRSTMNSSSRSIKSTQCTNEINIHHIPFSYEINHDHDKSPTHKYFQTSLNPLSPVFHSTRQFSLSNEQKQDHLSSETKYPLLSETSDYGSSTDQDLQSIRQLSSQTDSSPLAIDFDESAFSYPNNDLTHHSIPFRRTSISSSTSSSSSSSPSSSMSNLSSFSSSSSSSDFIKKKILSINNNNHNINTNEFISCTCDKDNILNRKRNRINSYPLRRYTTINFCENCQIKRTKMNSRSKYILNRQIKPRLNIRTNDSTKFAIDLTGLNIRYTIEYHSKCTNNCCKCLTMNDWLILNNISEYSNDLYYNYFDSNNSYDIYLNKTNDNHYPAIYFNTDNHNYHSLMNNSDYFRLIQSAPTRTWFRLSNPTRTRSTTSFTVMNYNILCDRYATRRIYGYCPPWALKWDYRRKQIFDELHSYSADIIALQEIETDQFHLYFLPELKKLGYDGVFSPKSRAKTMTEHERKFVDGCAIFYRQSKFRLIKHYLVEFNQLAMLAVDGAESYDMMNRVMTKDNIGLVALLEMKDEIYSSNHNSSSKQKQMLFVCTAHIHWDPEYCDVKVIQTLMLLSELKTIMEDAIKIYRPNSNTSMDCTSVPLVLCGDFNSLPDSGVIELMKNGKISTNHADFKDLRYESYLKKVNGIRMNSNGNTDIAHHFKLQSAYETTSTSIMPYTNYTYDFKGIIDYVFYSVELMRVLGVLGPVDPEWLQSNRIFGFPHPNVPSDHFSLLVEFELNPKIYDLAEKTDSNRSTKLNPTPE